MALSFNNNNNNNNNNNDNNDNDNNNSNNNNNNNNNISVLGALKQSLSALTIMQIKKKLILILIYMKNIYYNLY